jgi:Tfp pilus assembly protein PilF
MSLIIDALKKTQQLRLNGSEGSPLLRYPTPNRTRGKNSKKQWIVIGAGLISLCILLFVLLRPASSPLATQTNGAIVPIEKKPLIPAAAKISSEPSQEGLSLPKDEDPLPTWKALPLVGPGQTLNPASGGTASEVAGIQGRPNVEAAFTEPSSHLVGEKGPSTAKSSLNEKRAGARVKRAPQEEKLKSPNRTAEGKNIPPLPPVTQKEEAPPKSIAVEQEGEKGQTLTSEVLKHFNSGVTFYNRKEFSNAIQAYQKVIKLDPTYVEAYNNLGIIYQTMGDAKSAFEAYQKATEINPRYEKGYNNLGLLFLVEDRYEEALEVFQKALAINSNNIESHINLGILFKKKGQGEKAIESYQKALAIDPLHRETHYNMALLYEHLENWELAISHYQQFIQLSSKSYPELVSRVQRRLNALAEANRNKRP